MPGLKSGADTVGCAHGGAGCARSITTRCAPGVTPVLTRPRGASDARLRPSPARCTGLTSSPPASASARAPGQRRAREEHRRPLRGEEPRVEVEVERQPHRVHRPVVHRPAEAEALLGPGEGRRAGGSGRASVQGGGGGRSTPPERHRSIGAHERLDAAAPAHRSVGLERRQRSEWHRAAISTWTEARVPSTGRVRSPAPRRPGAAARRPPARRPTVRSSSGRARWSSSTSAGSSSDELERRPPVPSAAGRSTSTPIERRVTVRARAPPVRRRSARGRAPPPRRQRARGRASAPRRWRRPAGCGRRQRAPGPRRAGSRPAPG